MWTTERINRAGRAFVRGVRLLKRGGSLEVGFSLLELLVVLSILAVTMSVAIPGIVRWIEDYRLKTTARQLVSDLQSAKMKAVADKVQHRVAFEPGLNRYSIQRGDKAVGSTTWTQDGIYRSLSATSNPHYVSGVTLSQNFTGAAVAFSPTGQASPAGTATFTSAHYSRNVVVTLTGRIRIE